MPITRTTTPYMLIAPYFVWLTTFRVVVHSHVLSLENFKVKL